MARLLVRTAIANLRSRPLQTALVALILVAASATLALAVSLRAGAADPYDKIARATNAADVHVVGHGRPRAAGARAAASRPPTGPFRAHRRARAAAGRRTQPRARRRRRAAAAHRPPEADRRALAVGRAGRGRARAPVRARRGVRVGQRLARPAARPAHRAEVVGIAVSAGRDRSWVARAARWPPLAPGGERSGASSSCSSTDRDASGAFVDDLRRRYPPDQLTRTTGATTARGHRPRPRPRRSSSAARASPRCSRSASSSPTRSAGGSSRRGATSAC